MYPLFEYLSLGWILQLLRHLKPSPSTSPQTLSTNEADIVLPTARFESYTAKFFSTWRGLRIHDPFFAHTASVPIEPEYRLLCLRNRHLGVDRLVGKGWFLRRSLSSPTVVLHAFFRCAWILRLPSS